MKNSKNQSAGIQADQKKGTQNVSQNGSQNGSQSESQSGQPSLLEKFFHDQLKDIYYAEQQLVKAIPELQKAATTEELEDAFAEHLKQTERHVKRLEKVFRVIGKNPEGKKCEAMDGLIKEARTIISETQQGSKTRDAALIIAAQKVEHYEIASYGGLAQLAITMGLNNAAELLEKTLQEEEDTDYLLTEIAETYINIEADEEGMFSWQMKSNQTAGAPQQ